MRVRVDQVIQQQPQPRRKDVPVAHVRPQGGLADAGTDLKDVRATGDVSVTGTLSVAGQAKLGDAVTLASTLGVDGDVLFDKRLDVNGKIATTDTTPSVSATDGALVVAGGAGIGDDLNVADKVTCNELYVSTTITAVQSASCSDLTVTTGALEHGGTTAGFFGTTPTTQPAPIADATGTGDVVAQLNSLLAAMRSLGLIDT